MQNAFMLPGVAHRCARWRRRSLNVNRLGRRRAIGGAVVWIKTTFTDETVRSWSTYYEISRPGRTKAPRRRGRQQGYALWSGPTCCQPMSWSRRALQRLHQGLEPRRVLRERGLDPGHSTVTGVCCESTARDAMMLNFKTIMVSDGNAAMTDDDHNASLTSFYLTFGDVMSTDLLIACLARNTRKDLAAAE